MEKELKARIQKIIRDDFKKSQLHGEALNRTKVGPALHKCPECGVHIYVGKSAKNLKAIKQEYPDVVQGDLEVDHIEPVIPLDMAYYDISMDTFIERVHCSIENLRAICKPCHKEKSGKEQGVRSENRKARKKNK